MRRKKIIVTKYFRANRQTPSADLVYGLDANLWKKLSPSQVLPDKEEVDDCFMVVRSTHIVSYQQESRTSFASVASRWMHSIACNLSLTWMDCPMAVAKEALM